MGQPLLSETWIHTYPKGVRHDEVGVCQIADAPAIYSRIRRLTHKIAAEKEPGGYPLLFQERGDLIASEGCAATDDQWEAEPTWFTSERRLWEHQTPVQIR